ncbi:MAG: choice-of-anchor D domain-containing protein, partial [Gemmatimonadota bacterium]
DDPVCGQAAVMGEVTVIQMPTPTAPPVTLCSGYAHQDLIDAIHDAGGGCNIGTETITDNGDNTYTVTCDNQGCSASATGTITEMEPCVAIAPDLSFCAGTVTVNDDLFIDNGADCSDGCSMTLSYTFDGNTAGTYTYTVTCDNTVCPPVSANGTVTVYPNPEVYASSNALDCIWIGETIELYGGPDGMISYGWRGPLSFISSEQSPTISNATLDMSGDYILTVIDANGCTDSDITPVKVCEPPDIDPPDSTKFGAVCYLGDESTKLVRVYNRGGDTLRCNCAEVIGANADDFTISISNGSPKVNPSDLNTQITMVCCPQGICFKVPAGDYVDVEVTFKPTPTGSHREAFLGLTSNDPDEPYKEVCLTGYACSSPGCPDIVIDPPSWDFEMTEAGTFEDKTFTISNVGCVDLHVTSISITGPDADQFSIVSGEILFVLEPGAPPHELVIRFQPTSTGLKTAFITILSDDCITPTFSASITGELKACFAAAPQFFICVGTPVDDAMFIDNGAGCSGCPACSLVLSYAFDGTVAGTFPYAVACTSDVCEPDTAMSLVTVVDSCMLIAPDFSICVGTPIDDNIFISAGASTGCYTILTYDCDTSAPGTCTYTVTDDNGVCEPCTASGTVTIIGLGAAALSNSPVCLGDAIRLFGEPDGMFIYTWDGPNAFFSSEQSPTITGASLDMSGDYILTATDTAGCTESDTVSVEVIHGGCPYIVFDPPFWNYGTLKNGTSEDKTFTISNIGCGDLHVTSTTLIGPNTDQFAIVSGDGSWSLAPETEHDVIIRFQPTSSGGKMASLKIERDDCEKADTTIFLMGVGFFKDPELLPFPPVTVSECDTLHFTVCNDSTLSLSLHSVTYDCDAFQILRPDFPQILDPSECETVYVEFCPAEQGHYSCFLNVNGDGPGEVIHQVLLSGLGCMDEGLLGDVNRDGAVDVVDVLVVVNYILGQVSLENAWCQADCNLDGFIDILDALGFVNVILEIGTCPPEGVSKGIHTSAVNSSAVMGVSKISVSTAQTIVLPIYLETENRTAGLQFTLCYDQDIFTPGVPLVTRRSAHMTVASSTDEGKLAVVLYSTQGMSIPAGAEPILTVPLRLNDPDKRAESTVRFQKVIVALDCVTQVPVQHRVSTLRLGDLFPQEYTLFQNYPNPFNPETSIDYQVPETANILLAIFNTLGQRVRTLVNTRQEPGTYTCRWDGCNESGEPVSSGIYFYRLRAGGTSRDNQGDFSQTKRMVLLR